MLKTRIVTLRNDVESKGGPAMFCYDGRLLKKYLLKHVRNVLIEDEPIDIYSTEPTSEQWWRQHGDDTNDDLLLCNLELLSVD